MSLSCQGVLYVMHVGLEVCCLWLNILLSFEAEKIVIKVYQILRKKVSFLFKENQVIIIKPRYQL